MQVNELPKLSKLPNRKPRSYRIDTNHDHTNDYTGHKWLEIGVDWYGKKNGEERAKLQMSNVMKAQVSLGYECNMSIV
jgi:hypothetical protein